ncbi:MAG: hypothetical protein KBD65_03215 [Candidatus Moranbacteria bacterium]|nr:hypothetical protein [Candidatus Moranbacteria bacterium]
MTTIYSAFRVVLAILGLVFLAACGGGGDDQDSIPTGAKVCELKLRPREAFFFPHYDVLLEGREVPGKYLSYLLPPSVKVSEDLIFTVGLSFPASPPERQDRHYTFVMQEWAYHTGEVSIYGCVINDLRPMDKVVIIGGKTASSRLFFVNVTALTMLDDGRVAATLPTTLLIEY